MEQSKQSVGDGKWSKISARHKKARMVLSLTSEPLILSEAEPKASMCVMPVVVAGV